MPLEKRKMDMNLLDSIGAYVFWRLMVFSASMIRRA